jgi:probable F420-dependent oxidoreductase
MKFGITPTEVGPFADALAQVEQAEARGFDACWVSEHHVQPDAGDQYWPASLLRLAAFAARTETLDLLTSVYLLPLHHPLETAEKVAVLDQISEGRLTLGVGLGYVQAEFDAYDVSMDQRGARFVEGVRILDRYLTSDGPFSFEGRVHTIDEWDPTPGPWQDPRPPILVGGWGDLALQRSIALGDGWITGLTGDVEDIASRTETVHEHAREAGMDPDDVPIPAMRETIVAETHEEAMRLGREYLHDVYLETYGSTDWSHPLLGDTDVSDFADLAADRFLIGTPNEVVEQVEALRDRAGVTHVGCRLHSPNLPHEVITEEIDLLADAVLPAFE